MVAITAWVRTPHLAFSIHSFLSFYPAMFRSSAIYLSKPTLRGNIGFIGLGNMGSRMAKNLIRYHQKRQSGQKVYVYDKYPNNDILNKLRSEGGIICESIEDDLVPHCETFMSMLPSSPHVLALYTTSILPALSRLNRSGALLIDSSTIDPRVSLKLHEVAKSSHQIMVDAPVSGGITGADLGTLTFMVGTGLSESDFQGQYRDFFTPMGNPIYCGGPSKGQSVKVCNNLILSAQMLGVAQGYALAEKLGVDIHKFDQIVNSSTGKCWVTEKYSPVPGLMENVPSARGYINGFMTDLMVKDLCLAIDAGEGTSVPVAEFCRQEYSKISLDGNGSLDFGYVFQKYRN